MENPDRAAVLAFVTGGPAGPVATSPLLEALGAEFAGFDPEAGTLTLRFCPAPLFRQGADVVQGGAVCAMLDFVMAFAAMAAVGPDGHVATTTLTTAFLAAADAENCVGVGRIDKAGRRLVYARAELLAGARTVATATSALLVIR